MKNLIQLKCTSCGANLSIEEKRETLFCEYCGTRLVLDNENEYIYRHIDEADIKRAETERLVKLKELEIDEIKHEENKKEFKKKALKGILITFACVLVYYLILVLPFSNMEKKSIKQEKELQQLVDEIMIDVENEKFDDAYIKAQSIKYTESWSSEIEEKWDNTRKKVINHIIAKEKEVTGKSVHKPEKNGFFSNLFK